MRLDGKVRRVMTSFVSVDLPQSWAPASFALPQGTVNEGEDIGVAGSEDSNLASGKLKGLRVLAVKVGPPDAPRYFVVHHSEGAGGSGSSPPPAPKKDDLDWSDV